MKSLFSLLLMIGCAQLFGQVTIDFTDPNTPTYGTNAQKIENVGGENKAMMWGGDVDGDGFITYNGEFFLDLENQIIVNVSPGNAALLTEINSLGNNVVTFVKKEYSVFDLDLDGLVSYNGETFLDLENQIIVPTDPGNAWLLTLINEHPGNINNSITFVFKQQLP